MGPGLQGVLADCMALDGSLLAYASVWPSPRNDLPFWCRVVVDMSVGYEPAAELICVSGLWLSGYTGRPTVAWTSTASFSTDCRKAYTLNPIFDDFYQYVCSDFLFNDYCQYEL